MDNKRPESREQNIKEGQSGSIKRRGDGLGKGPVGNRTDQFIKEHYTEAAKKASRKSDDDKPGGAPKAPAPNRQAPQSPGQNPNKAAGQASPQNKGLLDDLGNMLGQSANNNSNANGLGGMFGGNTQNTGQSQNAGFGGMFGGNVNSSQGSASSGGTGGGSTGGSGGGINFGGSGMGNSGGSGGGNRGKISIFAIIIIVIILIFVFRGCLCGGSSCGSTGGLMGPGSTGSSSGTANSGNTNIAANTGSSSGSNSLLSELTGESYDTSTMVSGYDYDNYYDNYNYSNYSNGSYGYSDYIGGSYGGSDYDMSSILEGLLGGSSSQGSSYNSYLGNSAGSTWNANTGSLNTNVAAGTPAKRTIIKGNGSDVVTLMVYVCGSDLESSNGAATMDIQEMLKANIQSDNVNIVIYTGGATQWQNNVISPSNNQIYQIKGGQLYRLENNMGNKAMTDPNTLTEFINYCSSNFPANRNMLILWDHGGGSVSGYAYDEKFKTGGYMSLAGINKALKNAGVTFDMIGFDTCLMATAENALMLSNYADYLVASEEVEPSTGWYYTDWLTALGSNTSMSTLELGKTIADSFISASNTSAWGLGCTLSVVDLAEFRYTVPGKLAAFSNDISSMIESGNSASSYSTVVNARTNSKEFGETERLDQIDLVNFADNLGTQSGAELADVLKSAVKYNAVSRGTSNAYGISTYFPYTRAYFANTAASIYNEIGVTPEYTRCIQQFASIEGAGQSLYGSSSYGSYGSLFDALYGGNSYSSSSYSSGDISDLLTGLLGGRELNMDAAVDFLANNQFDPSALFWQDRGDGTAVIKLPEEQWDLVQYITLNAFYNDGEGYYDLGADNYFQLDDEGNLVGSYNGTWLSIEGRLIAYYFDSMTYDKDEFTISGHVPVLYNGESANLMITFDSSNPKGYISGLEYKYDESEQGVMLPKTLPSLEEGAAIDFLADYYNADGEYEDTYMIGDQWSYEDGAEIANITVDGGEMLALYQFTDIYNNNYWTPAVPKTQE